MAKGNKNKVTAENTNAKGELLDNADTRPTDSAIRSKNQAVETWLNSTYDFRYNTIKQKPEYRKKPSAGSAYLPLDKYTLLTIKRELDASGLVSSKDNLMDILCSSYSEAINPVKHYFKNVFPWDEVTDHISELALTVKAKNADQWKTYLKKWLVGVVANVFIDERCANHTMLVLTGAQGKFKTSWLENLCPKTLTSYLYTGKLNLESKDCLTLIAENLFINIDDQLKQLHKKDENELKNLITINYVKYRRPYDPIITEYPHLCSFMGSVNGNEFLNDPTGSRRFLPFEVENIDIKAAQQLDMEKVWAQAYHLYKTGYRYWFNDEEIDELNTRNAEFSMISKEEEYLQYYFSNVQPEGVYQKMKFYPTSIIKSKLETLTHDKLSDKKMGEALNKLGYVKKQKRVGGKSTWGFTVYEKTQDEIAKQSLEEPQPELVF
jgi:predicted P-loop ATPase